VQKVIERALNLLAFLLTAGRPVTADEIRVTVAGYGQAEDEAFRRMFERDKDLLRRLGIPLELKAMDAWEVEFGYVIPDEAYALADPGLTDDERAALLLAAQAVRFGGQPAGPDAILKLGGAPLGNGGEPLAADLGDGRFLPDVYRAVAEHRTLAFRYRGRDRLIHPYGLVHRRGHWYVVGPEASDPETVKAFRLDRADGFDVGETAEAFQRPPGFRAGDVIPETPWETGAASVEATVVFDAEVAWLAERQLGRRATIEHDDDGRLLATVPVAGERAFLGWLIGFEDHAELLGPPELRRRFIDLVAGSPS